MEEVVHSYEAVSQDKSPVDENAYELVTIRSEDEIEQDNGKSPQNTNTEAKKRTACQLLGTCVVIVVLLMVPQFALSVFNSIATQFFQAESQLGLRSSGDQILTLEKKLVNLDVEINETRLSIEELREDIHQLIRQLDNSSAVTHKRINKIMEENMDLQNQINTIRTSLGYQNVSNCGPGLWRRVAYLNMSDPSHQCPPVWREYSANGVRACGCPANAPGQSCYSMNYLSSTQFNRVCGRVIGYQVGSTDAFEFQQYDINDAYVDGVSITYGEPRTHIWTYAAGISEIITFSTARYTCPCLAVGTSFTPQTPPLFVGNNYYCESGNPISSFQNTNTFQYTNDPLWDGQNCEGRCCSDGRTPPWFSVQLTLATTSDIEVRICGLSPTDNDDTPIELLELHVQ